MGIEVTAVRQYEGIIQGYVDPVFYEAFDHPAADEEVLAVFEQNYAQGTVLEVRQTNWFDITTNQTTTRILFQA